MGNQRKSRGRFASATAISCGIGAFDTAILVGVCGIASIQIPAVVIGGIFVAFSAVVFLALACCHTAADMDDMTNSR